MDNLTGTCIKGYELQEQIGTGGFGAVYRAHQPAVGREVAIKVILPKLANAPEFIRRFEIEAQTIARLEHMHIAPLYDYWRDPDGTYLVMRYFRGGSLAKTLLSGPYDLPSTALLLDQVASALTVAHRNQVIHRDLKPGNILLDEDGNAYLADFGIAKDLGSPDSGLTAVDAIVGSLDYISPEQAGSEPITSRTDIYSLGVVLYEMLKGEHPFPGISSVERLYKHLNDRIPKIDTLDESVCEAINEVIQKATAKDPAKRYADALALAVAFREAARLNLDIAGENIVEQLTRREQEILRRIVAGSSNKDIARDLFVELSTVKWYATQIYRKLGVRSRMQCIVRARELSLVVSGDGDSEQLTITGEDVSTGFLPQPENPYKGLRPFQPADTRDFFGREKLIATLLSRMGETGESARFLAVVGPSGSGKSSVVRAGLIPALWRGDLRGSEKWFIVDMLPGPHPLDELEIALMRIAADQARNLHEPLTRDPRGLQRAAQLVLPDDGSELVVIVDQFEEVFTLVEDETERQYFLDQLYTAVAAPRSRVRVVITLRADFYDKPLHYAEFGELVRSRMETILPLSADELHRAISKPAEQVGVTFEEGLVATIVSEIHYQPGALPLLQYALTELFDNREARRLTFGAYERIGKTTGALSRRAEAIYDELDEAGQEAARQMFMRLVTLGEGTEDTRRRVPRSELLAVAADPDVMEEVIDLYTTYRLLSLDHDPATRSPMVEVAHEAILREWQRLRDWLDESRHDIRHQRLLAAAAADWEDADRDTSYLLRGTRLEQFDVWAAETRLALTQEERDFLETSISAQRQQEENEHERQTRELELARHSADLAQKAAESARQAERAQRRAANRLRYLVGMFALAAVIAVVLSLFAFGQRNQAQNARATSDTNALIAQSERDKAQELALVNGAQAALAKGDIETALALAVVANRGAHPSAQAQLVLSRAAYPPGPIKVFRDHQGYVWAAAYSPDGKTIVSLGDDGLIWRNVESGEIRQRFPIGYATFSFTPDSRQLLTASWFDGNLVLWDLATGQEIRRFASDELLGAWSLRVIVNSDGHTFLSNNGNITGTGQPGKLLLWNIETGEVIRTFDGHQGGIESFKISPDGRRVLSSAQTGEVILWDIETGAIIHRFEPDDLGISSYISGVVFLPDGHRAVLRSQDGPTALWDLDSFHLILNYDIPPGPDPNVPVAVSPDGHAVITGGSQTEIWDVESGLRLATLPVGTSGVGFSRDSRLVFTASGGAVRLWDWQNGAEIQRWLVPEHRIIGFALSPDGRTLLTTDDWDTEAGAGCGLTQFDTTTGAELWRSASPQSSGGGFVYAGGCAIPVISPDGYQFVVGRGDGQAILWDAETHQPLRAFTGNTGTVAAVAFSPDGHTLLTGGGDGTLILWDVDTGQEIRRYIGHTMAVFGLVFSPDGRTFLSSSQDSTIILWDVESGQEIRRLLGHTGGVNSLDISPDGRYALSGADDGRVILWDMATGAPVHTLIGHEGSVIQVGFSADGQYALSSDGNNVAILWDLTTGDAIRYYDEAGTQSSFDPTGRSFLARDWNTGMIHRFRIDSADSLLAWTLDNRYVRELTCTEREQYNLEPGCDAEGSFPTRTPYATAQPTPGATVIVDMGSFIIATTTPTMTPNPTLVAHRGEQRGEVAPGHAQVWTYEGHKDEVLTIRVNAEPGGTLDALIIITGPDGGDLNASGDLFLQLDPPESDDIEPGVNTDSLITDLVLPADGTYRIEVSGAGYRTGGAYTLIIESTSPESVTPTPENILPGS